MPLPEPEKPKVDPELQRLVDEALKPLVPLLKKPKVRQILEREPAEQASEMIVERLRKDVAKNRAADAAEGATVKNGKG